MKILYNLNVEALDRNFDQFFYCLILQLWCLGTDFVMTNEVHTFNILKNPIWYLNIESSILLWSIIYIVALSFLLITKFHLLKNRKE